jgi:hypothetical protein
MVIASPLSTSLTPVPTTAVGYLTDRLIGPDTKPAAAVTINDKSKSVRAAKKLVADSRLPPMAEPYICGGPKDTAKQDEGKKCGSPVMTNSGDQTDHRTDRRHESTCDKDK